MKIAYIISDSHCVSPYNGIRMQAKTWADELENQGHQVVKVNPWDNQEWQTYDIIHLFSNSHFFEYLHLVPNHNIVFSPIIDSFQPIWRYKFATHWGFRKLRLSSSNYNIRQASNMIKHWYVRSRFEYRYVNEAYGIPAERITTIPLSYRIEASEYIQPRERFCLHVSKITDERKNVSRLVDAARKYGFKLVLAGSASPSFDSSLLKKKIDSSPNVEYLGRVSDEKLIELYCSAKVFALPSINEGVGLVAVEAAACGCDIVITNIGGPQEYYNGLAFTVDPYDIDEIGKSVLKAMQSDDRQPQLMNHIKAEYSLTNCVRQLSQSYNLIIH